jgi:hypothetical protein
MWNWANHKTVLPWYRLWQDVWRPDHGERRWPCIWCAEPFHTPLANTDRRTQVLLLAGQPRFRASEWMNSYPLLVCGMTAATKDVLGRWQGGRSYAAGRAFAVAGFLFGAKLGRAPVPGADLALTMGSGAILHQKLGYSFLQVLWAHCCAPSQLSGLYQQIRRRVQSLEKPGR